GSPIVSSPAVSSGKLFLGTRNKGMLCLADAVESKKIVLNPPEAVAGRTGCADDRGLPAINGDTSDQKWPQSPAWKTAPTGSLSVNGTSLVVPFSSGTVAVDPATGETTGSAAATPGKDESVRIYGLSFRIDDG